MAVLTTGAVVTGALRPHRQPQGPEMGGSGHHNGRSDDCGLIAPDSDPLLYGDNTDVTAALQAGQIDAALFDLPTALYLSLLWSRMVRSWDSFRRIVPRRLTSPVCSGRRQRLKECGWCACRTERQRCIGRA